ncbi:hypothetical protein OC834_006294 [Tilletia horrida]|uniref:Uncharacterized protein n=1 Tax=Tilletia horrida TaxID=155126 RepID=A0AAN6JP43_9BASI|nr:hypothetical protein OC834_006294 [Tilletia horrida]KAK0524897.1 hypothetical protein OC842_005685 [Tilletia horrida]KAK0529143.1 hypothetical protein OC835_004426 [Tilletia horrida]
MARLSSLLLAAACLVAATRVAASPAAVLPDLQRPFFGTPSASLSSPPASIASSDKRVRVQVGVMSRCPDAHYCEATLDRILDRVNSKVSLHLSYLGHANASAPWSASCLHGDIECAGNVHQLCVANALRPERAGRDFDLSPSQAQQKWYDVVLCMNYAKARIGEESLIQECLKTVHGAPSWDGAGGIGECVHGKQGTKLLLDSIAQSDKLGIVNSCTILLEGGTQCVRDGGVWKRCTIPGGHEVGDFVAEIENQYTRINEPKKGFL